MDEELANLATDAAGDTSGGSAPAAAVSTEGLTAAQEAMNNTATPLADTGAPAVSESQGAGSETPARVEEASPIDEPEQAAPAADMGTAQPVAAVEQAPVATDTPAPAADAPAAEQPAAETTMAPPAPAQDAAPQQPAVAVEAAPEQPDLSTSMAVSDGNAVTGGSMGQSPATEQLAAVEVNGESVNNAGTLAAANIGASQDMGATGGLDSSPAMTPNVSTGAEIGLG